MRKFFFLFLVFWFAHCAGGNLKVKVKPDLSGELLILEKRLQKKSGGHFFGSGLVAESETELSVKERFYTFNNITQIAPPGLRFFIYKEDSENLQNFVIAIDTSAKSKLIEALKIRKSDIESFVSEAQKRDDIMRFNTLSEHIQIELNLPFQIVAVKFKEPRKPGEWTARNDGSGKVVINIPLVSCFANEHPTTEVIVQYKD
jgi:hypothetical protein